MLASFPQLFASSPQDYLTLSGSNNTKFNTVMELFRTKCDARLHWGKGGWPLFAKCFDGAKEYPDSWCDFGCAAQVGGRMRVSYTSGLSLVHRKLKASNQRFLPVSCRPLTPRASLPARVWVSRRCGSGMPPEMARRSPSAHAVLLKASLLNVNAHRGRPAAELTILHHSCPSDPCHATQ